MTAALATPRPLEVADVIRAHGAAFLDRHGAWLSAEQRRALRDLAACRTAVLGGHVEQCQACGHERIAYNSCRNRHCPKCQALSRARWLHQETKALLPVPYYHVVFTLPREVADVALANPRRLYDSLFQAAAATLRDVAANPRHLGASLGVLLVLHTWGQNLSHHPHVHGVVTGGGLSCDARGVMDAAPHWRSCRPGFFLPVRILSRVFRGKYLELLHQAWVEKALVLPGKLAALQETHAWALWRQALQSQAWVVYAKPPFGGPEQVLKYLARYTHRVAISNARLQRLADGQVTFRYKDYADERHAKSLTLPAEEFLRRFVQHVLPRGFVKMRHYGLLANRHREERLTQCRTLLWLAWTTTLQQALSAATTIGPARTPACAHCGSCRITVRELPRDVCEPAGSNTS
jgi:hypothetical protein